MICKYFIEEERIDKHTGHLELPMKFDSEPIPKDLRDSDHGSQGNNLRQLLGCNYLSDWSTPGGLDLFFHRLARVRFRTVTP